MGTLFALALVLVVYLSLALLPKGQTAVMGLVIAGGLLLLGFVAVPNATPMLTLALIGAGMAAVAQAARGLFATHIYYVLLGLLPLLALAALTFRIGD
jgi:hypothetical protein